MSLLGISGSPFRSGIKAIAKIVSKACEIITTHQDKINYVIGLMSDQHLINIEQDTAYRNLLSCIVAGCNAAKIVAKQVDRVNFNV